MVSSRAGSKQKRSLLVHRVLLLLIVILLVAAYIQVGTYLWRLGWVYATVLLSLTAALLFVGTRVGRGATWVKDRLNRLTDESASRKASGND
jgi:hypothetical protein